MEQAAARPGLILPEQPRTGLWALLKDYKRPDLHPDDSDSTELVTTGRAKLFGEDETLNDKLVGAAA